MILEFGLKIQKVPIMLLNNKPQSLGMSLIGIHAFNILGQSFILRRMFQSIECQPGNNSTINCFILYYVNSSFAYIYWTYKPTPQMTMIIIKQFKQLITYLLSMSDSQINSFSCWNIKLIFVNIYNCCH